MQKRNEKVETGEIQVDEVVDQVWLWEIVAWWVEAQGRAFPLSTVYEQGKGGAISEAGKHLLYVGSRTRVGAWPCAHALSLVQRHCIRI